MSRHRFVRDLDIEAERDDGALSDGADDLTPEQHAQLEDGIERVRAFLGDEAQSGLSDVEVKDTLWDAYFNVDQAVEWLIELQEQRRAAQERKAAPSTQLYPQLDEYGAPAVARGPLIHQAQQQQQQQQQQEYYPDEGASYETPSPTRLSTIEEKTELSESTSTHRYPSGSGLTNYQSMHQRDDSSSTVSYGQVIQHYDAREYETFEPRGDAHALSDDIVDPNTILPSPPQSALALRRVDDEAEPDDSASTRTASPPPHARPRSAAVPVVVAVPQPTTPQREVFVDARESFASERAPPAGLERSASSRQRAIPVDVFAPRDSSASEQDQQQPSTRPSSSSRRRTRAPPVNKPLPDLPPPSEPRHSIADSLAPSELQPAAPRERKSKLSQLASTRMSTITKSSRLSTGTIGTSSVLTFPALRPSAESAMDFASVDPHERARERAEEEARWRARSELIEEEGEEELEQEGGGALELGHGDRAMFRDSMQTETTAMSTIVRRAIQSAMALEAVDRDAPRSARASPTKDTKPEPAEPDPASTFRPTSATSSGRGRTPSSAESVDVFGTTAAARQTDTAFTPKALPKLDTLAVAQPPLSGPDKDKDGKAPSKLSLLAQASKEKQRRAALLHRTHTEYLTPTANGPTATTAITTSYQTLGSLQPLDSLPPSLPPPGYAPPSGLSKSRSSRTSAGESKDKDKDKDKDSKPSSKLAAKARAKRRAENDAPGVPEGVDDPQKWLPEPTPVIFSPDATRALKAHERERRKSKERRKSEDASSGKRSGGDRRKDRSRSRAREREKKSSVPVPRAPLGPFAFDTLSPDDVVFNARRGTALGTIPGSGASTPSVMPASTAASRTSLASTASAATYHTAAIKEREKKEKADRLAAQKKSAEAAAGPKTPKPTPKKIKVGVAGGGGSKSGASTPTRRGTGMGNDAAQLDMAGLNLGQKDEGAQEELPPKMAVAREKVLEEARAEVDADKQGRKAVSLVVVGHVDAGKSTLTGRLMYALGRVDDKEVAANERASERMGKGSFSWAWQTDGTLEERERGVTMDIAQQTLWLPHRVITILDAPGHRDFIPNMISGAAQADCALLVVDASPGEFEAGFARGGQTREHVLLVRSLGVTQVVVAVNKLDVVGFDQARYEDVCEQLRTFLAASGFAPGKVHFVPVAAMAGVGFGAEDGEAKDAMTWYTGPSLIDLLDKLNPPTRDIDAPVRIPIANVFKGTGSSTGVAGRVLSGVVQVGEKLRVLPGEETAIVKSIQNDEESRSWAAAGANVTLYLTAIDPIHLSVGFVLCPQSAPVPLATVFSARIIVFDIQIPILAGTSVELFVHSHDVPASISKLTATLDRATGAVTKQNPRVLTKGLSAEVQITVRATSMSGPASRAQPVPLEPFSVNKEMGRVLVRRGGETVAAGIVLSVLG